MENMERKVLAKVGDKEITNIDLETIISSFDPYRAMQFQTEEGKERLLKDIVAQELFLLEAQDNKLQESDVFKEQLAIIAENLLKQLAVDNLLSTIAINDDEMLKYYEENKAEFVEPESASAKHILVEDEDKAKDIKKQLDKKEISFEDAAVAFSTCPSKQNGGDLGTFSRGQMVPEFEEAVFSMKKGEVSEPVKTQFGYHIILLNDINEAKQSAYEEVKEELENKLRTEKQIEVYTKKVNELMDTYKDKFEIK